MFQEIVHYLELSVGGMYVHNGKQHATVTNVLMKGTANYCCGVVPLPTPSYMTLIPNPLHLTPSGRPHCTSPCNVPIII